MEINLQFIIDIAPIVLLIVVIIQLAEFRKTWWQEWIAGNMNKSKESIDQMTGVAEKFEGLNKRFDWLDKKLDRVIMGRQD